MGMVNNGYGDGNYGYTCKLLEFNFIAIAIKKGEIYITT